MQEFGAFEAKTHFSEILAAVIKGKKFIIKKHGKQVAMIIPFDQEKEFNTPDDSIEVIKKLRKGVRLGKGLSIKKMKERGRK